MNYYNFTKYAKEASQNGHKQLAKRIKTEGKIVSALIDTLLDTGANISAYGEEDCSVKNSTNKALIMTELYETDTDLLVVRDEKGDYLGRFMLVYGNDGYDVISDYSDNPFCEGIWQTIKPIVGKAESDMM